MATITYRARGSSSGPVRIYLAVLIVALAIVGMGTAIWLFTDNNPGTNVLATDEKAITRSP
jgi:flagellar basal body-associated protein FliL